MPWHNTFDIFKGIHRVQFTVDMIPAEAVVTRVQAIVELVEARAKSICNAEPTWKTPMSTERVSQQEAYCHSQQQPHNSALDHTPT